jgi:hypothetical protein
MSIDKQFGNPILLKAAGAQHILRECARITKEKPNQHLTAQVVAGAMADLADLVAYLVSKEVER